jgi:polysaccharide deacetylase family protein (PEP-CTERM system associated)
MPSQSSLLSIRPALRPVPHVRPAERIVNAMTIDVEDYFHVSAFNGVVDRREWESFESRVGANTDRLLQMFDEAGVTATFFILGWVAERFPGLVRRIARQGHEIASHGYAHQLVYELTPEQFRADVARAKAVIEHASGQMVSGYRAPSFSITRDSLWALDILIEEGHLYDASIYPIHHDRYGIPDAPRHVHRVNRPAGSIWELPGSTIRRAGTNLPIGGGGYFRLLPYAWTRWGINQLNGVEQQPAIFYLHPWEIDPDQPRLRANALSEFRHYRNLNLTEERLRKLLSQFRFGPLNNLVYAQTFGQTLNPAAQLQAVGA